MNNELMRIDEAAKMIGYSVGATYNLVGQRRIPFIKLSKKALRFDRAELEAWIDEMRRNTNRQEEPEKLESVLIPDASPAPDVAETG